MPLDSRIHAVEKGSRSTARYKKARENASPGGSDPTTIFRGERRARFGPRQSPEAAAAPSPFPSTPDPHGEIQNCRWHGKLFRPGLHFPYSVLVLSGEQRVDRSR